MQSRVGALSKFLLVDLIGSVVWFPVWWYTIGLKRVVLGSVRTMKYRWREYGLGIWLKNFFVPMYGEYDWAGRLISLLVRFAVLVGRLIALFIESTLYLFGTVLWIAAPVVFALLAIINGARSLNLQM